MRKQHNKGFTLVEIIVSIALLGMIALFMLPMSIQSVQFSKWNSIKLTATNLAYTQLEWMKTLDYKTELGLKTGPSPFGIVEKDQYLNSGTAGKTVEGVEYTLLTNIYWQSAVSSTGKTVTKATKMADVTVTAWDPVSGTQKSYSVIGTLMAFEGERILLIPKLVSVMTGQDFTAPAVGVTVKVENPSGTTVTTGVTDAAGKVNFEELDSSDYYLIPEKSGMISRPAGITGTYPNQDYTYKILMKEDEDRKTLYVDYPAYIHLPDYSKTMLDNAPITLTPVYTPPAGEAVPVLTTNLTGLTTRPLWRSWEYDVNDISYTYTDTAGVSRNDTYYLMDGNNGWNGIFLYDYNVGTRTDKNLSLSFMLKENVGTIVQTNSGNKARRRITVEVEFTSDVTNIGNISFVVKDVPNFLQPSFQYSVESITLVSGTHNRYRIVLYNTNRAIDTSEAVFTLDTRVNNLVNSFGIKLPVGVFEINLND